MIPVLYAPDETEFQTQGIGALTDAISCTVTEERNGAYELELQYPAGGIHFDDIADRCIITATPSPYRLPQPFRIYRITKPLGGVCTVYAQHISYDLSGVPLHPFSAQSAPQAMAGLQSNASVPSPFAFWTDKATAGTFTVSVPSATRSVLGGQAGSILDVYGGEYEWDKFTVKLHNRRGQDNGVTIRYGKNLTDLEQDRNIANVATGIYPYWTDADGNLVTCDPPIIPAPGTYNFTRVIPVDFSQDFDSQPTPQQLQARAESYVQANNIGVPTVSITASFVQLDQTEEYRHLALLEKCDLCDTVTIQFEQLGVNAKAKIVAQQTDVLLERYLSVTIGDARTNIADTIAGQQQTIQNQNQQIQQRPTVSVVESIANQITAAILGAQGGSVRLLDTNGDGEPDTLYLADDPDPAKAKKVWRFNYEGWGASENGYNGPFSIEAALGIGMYADFITAGTFNANLIKAGILQSLDGKTFINLETGQAQFTGKITSDAIDLVDKVTGVKYGTFYLGVHENGTPAPAFLIYDANGNAAAQIFTDADGNSLFVLVDDTGAKIQMGCSQNNAYLNVYGTGSNALKSNINLKSAAGFLLGDANESVEGRQFWLDANKKAHLETDTIKLAGAMVYVDSQGFLKV